MLQRERRILFVGTLIVAAIVLAVGPAVAEEQSMAGLMGKKLLRGIANVSTGWMEVPKQIYRIGKEEGILAGALRGPIEGLGMFAGRTIGGAYEILTFPVPIPNPEQPLFEPAFVWEPETAYQPQRVQAAADSQP